MPFLVFSTCGPTGKGPEDGQGLGEGEERLKDRKALPQTQIHFCSWLLWRREEGSSRAGPWAKGAVLGHHRVPPLRTWLHMTWGALPRVSWRQAEGVWASTVPMLPWGTLGAVERSSWEGPEETPAGLGSATASRCLQGTSAMAI